jgi:hypothetical protein
MSDSKLLASLDVKTLNKKRDALEALPGNVRHALIRAQRVFLSDTADGEDGYIILPPCGSLTTSQRFALAQEIACKRGRGEEVFGVLMHQDMVSHAFLPPTN